MLEVRTQIRQSPSLPWIDDIFLRRDYDKTAQLVVSLTAGVKTEVQTHVPTIEFLYVGVTTSDATINLYRNLSPEWWEFKNGVLIFEVTNCDRISFKSNIDAEITIYAGGS